MIKYVVSYTFLKLYLFLCYVRGEIKIVNPWKLPSTFNWKSLRVTSEVYSYVQGNFICLPICKYSSSTMTVSENVLSRANKENCINLLNSFKSNEFFISKTLNKAAVLVPLCKHNDKLAFLYTIRALHLKVNGGEIAFPGGRFDESDSDLERTALREAYEEVGIPPEQVKIWGKGPEIHRPDVKVTPVLGYIKEFNSKELKINPNEVSGVFLATLDDLSSSKYFRVTRFRSGKKFVYQTPVFLVSSQKIWGLTAYISHIILSTLIPKIYTNNIKFKPSIQRVLH